MGHIVVRIEIPEEAVIYTDRQGRKFVQFDVEQGAEMWHTLELSDYKNDDYGTGHHNSASIIIKNEVLDGEEEVSTRISIDDPRGGFVMESRVNETGHYLSVPHHEDSLLHIEMEHKNRGFHRLKTSSKVSEEEE